MNHSAVPDSQRGKTMIDPRIANLVIRAMGDESNKKDIGVDAVSEMLNNVGRSAYRAFPEQK